jgi:hypothetical protein
MGFFPLTLGGPPWEAAVLAQFTVLPIMAVHNKATVKALLPPEAAGLTMVFAWLPGSA